MHESDHLQVNKCLALRLEPNFLLFPSYFLSPCFSLFLKLLRTPEGDVWELMILCWGHSLVESEAQDARWASL